jgi:serine/threonine-protein kinase
MVDKIKVPIVIGVLLFSILLVLLFLIKPLFSTNEPADSSSSSSRENYESNIVDETPDVTADSSGNTEVPELVGKFYSLTKEKYLEFFTFEVEYEFDDEIESDIIIKQDIEKGTFVEQGSVIKLVVSKGPEGGMIPKFDGLSVSQYENELKQAGISNYSLVKSSSTWGVPDTISQLQIDGKSVSPGVYFSNKDGKKLIVFYISKDASYVPQTVTKATVTTASYTTGTGTGVVTTQAVTQQPATEATLPPATDPPATLPPATDPPAPPPTDPPVVTPPEGGGEIEVW